MENLWSPWRSNYIESFKHKKKSDPCILCEALSENINDDKCLKVLDGKLCYVMMNLYPYNSGHLMIIPNRHLHDLNDLPEIELIEMMNTVRLSMKALDHVMKPQGYNFGANFGRAAGAGIDEHLHFHLVPRWNGDTNFMPSIGEVKVISQDLLVTKKNLIVAYKEIISHVTQKSNYLSF